MHREAVKTWGAALADKLFQRLNEISASETLGDLYQVPAARCHQLSGNRQGQLAVDLKHPYRLIFEPRGGARSYIAGTELDRTKVTAVTILEVTDYHG